MIPFQSMILNLPHQIYSMVSNIQDWNSENDNKSEIDTKLRNSDLNNMVYELIRLKSVPYLDSESIINYNHVCKKWSQLIFKGMHFTKKTIKFNVPYRLNGTQVLSLKITLKGNSQDDEFSDSTFDVRYINTIKSTTYLINRMHTKVHSIPCFDREGYLDFTSYGTLFEETIKKVKLYITDKDLNLNFTLFWGRDKEITFTTKNLDGLTFQIRIFKSIINQRQWKNSQRIISKEELLKSVLDNQITNDEVYSFNKAAFNADEKGIVYLKALQLWGRIEHSYIESKAN